NEQFVRLLYRDVLGRTGTPSTSEMEFQLKALGAGTAEDRARSATSFFLVPEFTSRVNADLNAQLLYFLFLQRDPTPTEYQTTRARITDDASVRQIIRELINSSEFRGLLI
ncbi:MAG TPA: hypothetical protein VES20_20410, partial [Bryobacteraceae bacterium]|nr:hypothetical protein [Bryobacteraceae bacterium]